MKGPLPSREGGMFGKGTKLGDDWYEVHPGVKMFFYDAASIEREIGAHGKIDVSIIDEATPGASELGHVLFTLSYAGFDAARTADDPDQSASYPQLDDSRQRIRSVEVDLIPPYTAHDSTK